MKNKIILKLEIDTCHDCPYKYTNFYGFSYCYKKMEEGQDYLILDEVKDIPEWCPIYEKNRKIEN